VSGSEIGNWEDYLQERFHVVSKLAIYCDSSRYIKPNGLMKNRSYPNQFFLECLIGNRYAYANGTIDINIIALTLPDIPILI